MNLTPELLSRYADGELSEEIAREVAQALRSDPIAQAGLDDLTALNELFGEIPPEPVSDELIDRLIALRPVPTQTEFEVVRTALVRRRSWVDYGMAAAALLLVSVGLGVLLHRPEVKLEDVARQTLDGAGRVLETVHQEQLVVRSGDALRTGERERLSYRMPDGALVVLMPSGSLEVGDPSEGTLFEVTEGTVLCSVHEQGVARQAMAGAYRVHVTGAEFGIRVEPLVAGALKSAGAGLFSRTPKAEVTVAVIRGSLEVGPLGDDDRDREAHEGGEGRELIEASERIRFRPGKAGERSKAWQDPIYLALMRRSGTEILPGYFDIEAGVVPLAMRSWSRERDGALVHVVSQPEALAAARYLILHLDSEPAMEFDVTRVSPFADATGLAQTSRVRVAAGGLAAHGVIAVPLAAFDGEEAILEDREIPASRSGLLRLELRPAVEGTPFRLKGALWAARPPVSSGLGAKDLVTNDLIPREKLHSPGTRLAPGQDSKSSVGSEEIR